MSEEEIPNKLSYSKDETFKIKDIYSKLLLEIFGYHKNSKNQESYPKTEVRIIHHDEDLCINSSEREILYTIQDLLGKNWRFKESIFGMCLYCNFSYVNNKPNFNNFQEIYRTHYFNRMKLIFDQYDDRFKAYYYQEFKNKYELLKTEVNNLKKKISDKFTYNLVEKIVVNKKDSSIIYLSKDIKLMIYNYIKFSLVEYYDLRNNIEKLRSDMKESYYKHMDILEKSISAIGLSNVKY